jgi:hypothetical protein
MPWVRKFDEPIALKDGRTLATLADAHLLIVQLPRYHQGIAHLHDTIELLAKAAENEGWIIDARRQLLQALKAEGLIYAQRVRPRSPFIRHSSAARYYLPLGWGNAEKVMSLRNLATYSVGGLVGASMLALSLSPASAFTLSGPSLEPAVASAQIDKVWWRGGWRGGGWRGGGWGWRGAGWRGPGWGWRGGGWGWGPAAVVGGLAAGALVGGYYGGYYGPGYGYGRPGYYGGWGPSLCGRSYCD